MNRVEKEIEKFKNIITSVVKSGFEESGSTPPAFFALCYKNDKFIITILDGIEKFFSSESDKEQAATMMKSFNQEVKPLAIAFVSEGWMSVSSDFDAVKIKPSQDPNRIEILSISFETYNKQAMQCWEIQRDNESITLVDYKLFENSDWSVKKDVYGRFSGLLKENFDAVSNLLKNISLN